MKIIDAIKIKGRPFEIPDCSRDDLPEFFKKMGYKVGAEIGVFRGEFSEKICKAGLKLYAIDPWVTDKDYIERFTKEDMNTNLKIAKKRLEPYGAVIMQKTSMEAVREFEDNSLDFVYIDGNHGFKFVTEDIFEWSKKVRPGGAISGHDYYYSAGKEILRLDVRHVVDAYAKAIRLKSWYVLGEKNAKLGEKRDKYRSWLWINPHI